MDVPVRWKGRLRLIEEGKNFDNIPPSESDPAFATLSYDLDNRALDVHTHSSGAIWSSKKTPTKQECVDTIATQALSDDEKDVIPAAKGLALCVQTFSEDRIGYIRVEEVGRTYAMVRAIVWL